MVAWRKLALACAVIAAGSASAAEVAQEADTHNGEASTGAVIAASELGFEIDIGDDPNGFKATNEWQRIEPGVKVPPGLHYRMDVSTGELYAKLPSDDDEQTKENTPIVLEVDTSDESGPVFVQKGAGSAGDEAGSAKRVQIGDDEYIEMPHKENTERLEARQAETDSVAALLHDKTVPLDLEELIEFAHDVDHGVSIIEQSLPQLMDIVENRSETLDRREQACRVIGACLRNNPDALAAVGKLGTKVITRFLSVLENEPTERDSLIVNRAIYVLSAALGDNRGHLEYAGANGGEVLRKRFQTGHSSTVYKLAQLVSGSLARPAISEDSWRRHELEMWASEFEKRLTAVGTERSADFADTAVLDALATIKRDVISDLPVSKELLEWLAKMAKKSHNHDASTQDPEWQLAELAGEVRHAVFGNPKAQRKHNAEDL